MSIATLLVVVVAVATGLGESQSESPAITIVGSDLALDSDLGITAQDLRNGDSDIDIRVDASQVDAATPGEYPLMVYVSTGDREQPTTITRMVKIVPQEPVVRFSNWYVVGAGGLFILLIFFIGRRTFRGSAS